MARREHNSQRQLKVGEEVRHALATILERGLVRDLGGAMVTVTEVRMSPDLRNADAFVIPLGGDDGGAAVAALTRAKSFLRRQVARTVSLKYVPDIFFIADDTFDEAGRIEALLRRPDVARDLEHGPDDDEA
jgi:ribosome-binding factor A